jgi:glycoside/pentoside/hexuronide:cation symporter, GPH family
VIPTRTLVAYGLPGLPLALLGIPLYIFLPPYYAGDLGVGLGAVGLVLLLARASDVITDPLVGTLSDRWSIGGLRRKPWLLIGAPILMLGLWMLFVPPAGSGALHLFGWSVCAYLGWTLIALPYQAWGAELSASYHERSRITTWRETWVILGTLLALVIPGVIIARGGSSAETLHALAVLLMVALPVTLLIALVVVPENIRGRTRPVSWHRGLTLLRQNKPFTRLVAAWLLNGIANALPATLFLLFVNDRLQAGDRAGLLLGIYFLAAVVALPAWLALARRWGKHRTWSLSMLWACLVFMWVPFLGAGDYGWFLLICVLSGASLGCDTAIPSAIQADVVDEDSAAGGGGRAGLYFGLWGMATKLALALAVGIAFPLLDIAGFVPGHDNTEVALLALALLYAGVPILFKLAATALMWNFPLDAARQEALRMKLELA